MRRLAVDFSHRGLDLVYGGLAVHGDCEGRLEGREVLERLHRAGFREGSYGFLLLLFPFELIDLSRAREVVACPEAGGDYDTAEDERRAAGCVHTLTVSARRWTGACGETCCA